MDEKFQELLDAIYTAEEEKRNFVKSNPKGAGNRTIRKHLYDKVELARKALHNYKRFNPHLY